VGHGSTEKEDERDGEREKRFRAEGDAAGCRQRSEEEGCFFRAHVTDGHVERR
jgi:hypothetical protein